jgi:hypothetical protein
MSDDMQQPRDTILLPDGVVLKAKLTVQCATLVGEPTEAQPEGVFCGNLIEGEAEITFEPGLVAEMGVPCPACSKRLSDQLGKPVVAIIPVALLIGEQVDLLPAEGEEDEAGVDGDDVELEEDLPVVELTPADQADTVED